MSPAPVGFGGPLVDLNGAIDLHFHSFPCLFPRLADDVEVAAAARDLGFRALMYKCHHESSVSRAMYVEAMVPGVRLFGGIVLNSYVGYVNPAAVEATLRMGGRAPCGCRPSTPPTTPRSTGAPASPGPNRVDGNRGRATRSSMTTVRFGPEVHEVLALIAEYDVMLGTAHLSPREIVALVPAARAAGVERVARHPSTRHRDSTSTRSPTWSDGGRSRSSNTAASRRSGT